MTWVKQTFTTFKKMFDQVIMKTKLIYESSHALLIFSWVHLIFKVIFMNITLIE